MIHLCEGPLDALAVIHLERLGDLTLNGAAVYAARVSGPGAGDSVGAR